MRARLHPLLICLMILLFLPCSGCRTDTHESPVAQNGQLDLTRWSPETGDPVPLDGTWEWYWDQRLSPDDFAPGATPPAMTGYLTLPGSWKGTLVDGRKLSGTGQATLRLRILLPPTGDATLGLRLFLISSAYRLWANGKLVASSGQVGDTAATEHPRRTLDLAKIPSETKELELVLQISNHYFNRGGVSHSIVLAPIDRLRQDRLRTWARGLVFAGSLLIMVIYHLFLYQFKNKDASTLYFSMYCMAAFILLCTSGETYWIANIIFPNVSRELADTIAMATYATMPSALYRFYRTLYEKEFPLCIQYLCDLRSVIFILALFFSEKIFLYKLLSYYFISSFFLMTFYTVLLIRCVMRGHDGALFLLIGSTIACLASINDFCGYLGLLHQDLIYQYGAFAFILSQALALARRFSNAFTAVEHLSCALERKNQALEKEMAARTHLASEIVTVSDEERRRLSHDLHDGLCQQLSGARLHCLALSRRLRRDTDVPEEVAQLDTLLASSVSRAYDLSRGLWPVEHIPGEAGPCLEELARRTSESSGVAITFSQDLQCRHCRNIHIVQVCRIAQEAVANAVKHARAGGIHIDLSCTRQHRLTLTVSDDGIGRGSAKRSTGGLGMRIMTHRARMIDAKLSVTDATGGGTVVRCELTCQEDLGSDGG